MNLNNEKKFWDKTMPIPECGCIVWLGTTVRHGYGQFWYKGKPHQAHRLAWEFARGPIPSGLFVCHSCDTPSCVNPHHLFLGTHKDNEADKDAKGRRRWSTKLTDKEIYSIRESSKPISDIAKEYHVTYQNIWSIKKRLSWNHAEKPYKTCACGHSYTRKQWASLPFKGIWPGTNERGKRLTDDLELRNCECGSTIAVPVGA